MKKLKLLILIGLLLPINAKALTGSINVSCTPSEAKAGDTVTCTVTATADGNVTAIELPYNLGEGAMITSYDYDHSKWHDNGIEKNILEGYPEDDLTGSFTIGTFKIKISDTLTTGNIALNFTNNIFYDSNDQENSIPNASTTINIVNTPVETPKGLKSLICTGCKGQFTITEGNYEYLNELSNAELTTFSLEAVANNSSDTITFCELIDANTCNSINPNSITFKTSGGNKGMAIQINVGTGTNATTYNIAIIKPDILIAELSSLTVGGKSIALTSSIKEYEVSLDDVSNYQITATVKDSQAFTIENASDFLNTNLSGENTYSIYIKPVDNSSGYASASYKITVKKSGTTPKPSSPSPSSPSSNVSNNPKTGGTSAFVMGLILIASLFASVYLYKRNMVEGNN